MLLRQCFVITKSIHSLCLPLSNVTKFPLGTLWNDNYYCHRQRSTNVDIESDRKRKVIELEIENLRDQGHQVPQSSLIKPKQWADLLNMKSASARRRFYYFLFTTQNINENQRVSGIMC